MTKLPDTIGEAIVDELLAHGEKNTVQYVYERLQEHFSQKPAIVYFAGSLSESEKKKLIASIKTKFPKSDAVEFVKDESLLGGIKIVYKDYIYEDSVARRLSVALS